MTGEEPWYFMKEFGAAEKYVSGTVHLLKI